MLGIRQGEQVFIQRASGQVLAAGAKQLTALALVRNPVVFVTRTVDGGAPGRLRWDTPVFSTVTNGIPQNDGSFFVRSSNGADVGTVDVLCWYPGANPNAGTADGISSGLPMQSGNVPTFQNGVATLVAGAIQVSNIFLEGTTFIAITRTAFGGMLGHERVDTRVNGNGTGSFFIRSSNAGDTSTFSWLAISGLKGL